MTVVAGMISLSKWAYIGADSAAHNNDLLQAVANPKVARFNTTLVGYAGNMNQGRKAFQAMSRMTERSVVWQFERLWRPEHFGEIDMILIEQGRIYELQGGDGSILECATTDDGETAYAAIGEGAAVALGSLYADRIDIGSVLKALHAAEHHVPGIRGPMLVLEQPQA